jgi:integrase
MPRPARRLTASAIPNLPPGTHGDPATVGLQLRVSARRDGQHTRSFLLRFKLRGAETRILLGHFPELGLVEARAAALRLREHAAQGIDPRAATSRRLAPRTEAAAPTHNPHSVAALVDSFLALHVRPRRKRPEYAEAMLRRDVLPAWGARDARTIEPVEVIELLDGIVARGSPVVANRVAALLSQMFRYAIHRRLVASSPVQLLFRPGGRERPRDRVLTDQELRVIVADPQAAFRFNRTAHAAIILLLTGQRRGELAAARWKEIDLRARIWTIPPENSKTGRGHLVPLSAAALEHFAALRRLAGGARFVLPNIDGAGPIEAKLLTRSVARCLPRLKKSRVEPFTLHDLRRTCRTGLARLGVRPDIAERVLNHTVGGVTGVYDVHSYQDEKRDALDRWAAHLAALTKKP